MRLYLRVIEGRNLYCKGRTPDLYVTVCLQRDKGIRRTQTIMDKKQPVWNESFEWYIGDDANDVVTIKVMDRRSKGDDEIGRVTINVVDYVHRPNIDGWYSLLSRSKTRTNVGEIRLWINITNESNFDRFYTNQAGVVRTGAPPMFAVRSPVAMINNAYINATPPSGGTYIPVFRRPVGERAGPTYYESVYNQKQPPSDFIPEANPIIEDYSVQKGQYSVPPAYGPTPYRPPAL